MLSARASSVATLVAATFYGGATFMSQDRARSLEMLVRQDCGSCHGMTLKGGLGPDLLATRLSEVPSDVLADIILDGIPGTPMPPWRGLLSEQDALWIADYLKTEHVK